MTVRELIDMLEDLIQTESITEDATIIAFDVNSNNCEEITGATYTYISVELHTD
jgi:hypothetical protein